MAVEQRIVDNILVFTVNVILEDRHAVSSIRQNSTIIADKRQHCSLQTCQDLLIFLDVNLSCHLLSNLHLIEDVVDVERG